MEVAGVEPASLLPSSRISTRLFYFGVSKGYEADQPTLSIRFKVIQSPIRQTTLVPWKMTPTPNYPSNHSGDGVDLFMPPTQPLRLPKQKTLPWRLRWGPQRIYLRHLNKWYILRRPCIILHVQSRHPDANRIQNTPIRNLTVNEQIRYKYNISF